MLKLFRKKRGAISIFLVIVLVPMLMVSSIFVDMSRIRLAGAMAASAGDLTLNTALTNYDAVLKDMYGLFATSQNMDEMFLNLEDYYRKSIEAAGVPADNVDSYVDQVMSFLKTSTGTDDLMNITVTDFDVSVPEGGHLGNPAVLKTQIVEFMKYRAPINLGMGLFEALNGMTKLDEQTELVEDKTEFYGEQQKLLAELEEGWKDLVYYQYSDDVAITDYIVKETARLDEIKVNLHDNVIPKTIKYLNNYENYAMSLSLNDRKIENSGNRWKYGTIGFYPTYGAGDSVEVDTIIDAATNVSVIVSIVEGSEAYNDGWGTEEKVRLLLLTLPVDSDVEQVYKLAKYHEEYKSDYEDKLVKMVRYLINAEAALPLADEEELKATPAGDTNLYQYTTNLVNDYLTTKENSLLHNYNQKIDIMIAVKDITKYTVEGSFHTANYGVKSLATNTSIYYVTINDKITKLTNAIAHFENVKSMLLDPNSDYNKTLTAWNNSANGLSDDTMGQNDLEEIKNVKDMVTVERVDSLITRLTEAKTTLENVKAEIEKYKFEGTMWKDIPTDANYKTINEMMAHHNISSITPENANSYDKVIASVQSTIEVGDIITVLEAGSSPDLTVDQRELFTWLYKNYGTEYALDSPNKTGAKDGEVDSIKSNLQSQADANNMTPSHTGSTEVFTDLNAYIDYLPSTLWTTSSSGDSTSSTNALSEREVNTNQDEMLKSSTDSGGLGTLLGGITDAISGMAVSLRDKMYIMDYVMNMFSYNTFEAEIVSEQEGNADAFTNWYTEEDGVYLIKNEYKKYEEQTLNLTNNSINPNMNYLYGSEVEYIIYGGDDPASSVGAAFGTIFMLRFAFNTVYALTDAELNNVAMTAATAVFGTPPLTPLIPFAKVAILLGFAIAESTYDLYQLKSGEAVPLMKTKDTWVMKASSAVRQIAGEVLEDVTDAVIDEGYELLSEALAKTDEELTAMLNSGTEELKLFTQSMVDSSLEQLYNYANEAVQQAVLICNDVNMDQQFISEESQLLTKEGKAEVVAERLNEWLGTAESDNDVLFEVKSIAVKILTDNDNANIIKIFDSINTTAGVEIVDGTSLDDSNLLNNVLKDIKTTIDETISMYADKANSIISGYKEEIVNEIKTAAEDGVDAFRDKIHEQISGAFGTSSQAGQKKSNVVASIMAWRYSDYLMLFLLVSIIANEEGVLLRIADVIELNMQHMNKEYAAITTTETVTVSRLWGLIKYQKEETTTKENEEAFKLNKSYTYIQLDATLEVEPLFMDMPFMKDTTDSILGGKNWYQIQYSGTLGY